MYTVVEIDKTFSYSEAFTPLHPYVYKSITTVSASSTVTAIATYWTDTFGADGAYNDIDRNITGIALDVIFETSSTDSLADCLTTENSFFFDVDGQVLYVHFPHEKTPGGSSVSSGQSFGYVSDTVRYFKNQLYRPIVQSVPNVSESADPLQYGIMSFGGGSIVLTNDNELFDVDEKLYGNTVRIKRGDDDDSYEDLVTTFVGYVKDYTTTTIDMTLQVADKRERLQVDYPTNVFSALTGIAEDTNGETIPDGYGNVTQVKAYPTLDGTGTVTFQWGTLVTSITQVYTFYDGLLAEVAHANFSTDGTFTLTDALCSVDGADPTNGLKEVYVTGRMRAYDNPADIIADLNDRLLDTPYTASNYNQVEWAAEGVQLADISLYMGDTKRLYEWIELIQQGTDWGFRYEDREKITLRRDDPTRAISVTVPAVAIRNSDMPVQQNAELYASSCIVKYGKNWRTGRFTRAENTDYEQDVIEEHRVKKIQTFDTLLTSGTDATAKALRVMQNVSEVRPIATVVIDQDYYPTPRIYDMVTVTLSLLIQGKRIPALWTYLIGDADFSLGDTDFVIGETHGITRTDAYDDSNGVRTYKGSFTGQVIGIRPIPNTDEIELKIRKREVI